MTARLACQASAPALRSAWPWRLLVALLALCIVTQGVTIAVQRTVTRVHFHVAVAGSAHAVAPAQASDRVGAVHTQHGGTPAPARWVSHTNPGHRNAHGHDHPPVGGHWSDLANHHVSQAEPARATPRLFVHTRELEPPPRPNRPAPTPPREQQTRPPHAELAHHDHAADMPGVVYVVDAAVSGSSPTVAVSLSRGMNDLDSLMPVMQARIGATSDQCWPDRPHRASMSHVADVPWRPPSV